MKKNQIFKAKPTPNWVNICSGTSGSSGTSGTSGSSGISGKPKTLNLDLNIQKVETKKVETSLSVLDQLKLLFEEKIEEYDPIEI